MKRYVKLLSALLASTMLFVCAGCGTDGSPASPSGGEESEAPSAKAEPKEEVEITWAMQGAANEIEGWQAVADTANEMLKDKNIKIIIQKINTASWDEYYQKITAQIAGGNCPDIGRIAESLMPTVIEKDQVMEITDKMSDINQDEYFASVFDNAGRQDGKTYGLPSGVYQKLIYFNKDMFDEKNVEYPSRDWDHPTTLDEIADMAKQLSSGEGVDRIFGFYGEADIFMVGTYAGEDIYRKDNTYTLTDTHKKIYKILNDMLNVDRTMPTPVETKIMGGMDMFRAGKVAMVCDGTWWHQTAREITDFDCGIAAAPTAGEKANAVSFIDNYVIWNGTKHPEESWEALKAIFSKECFDVLARTGNGGIPVNRKTLEEHESDLIGERFDEVSKVSFIQSLDHTYPMPYNANFNEVSQQTGSVLEPWMVGSKSLDDMLVSLEDTLKNLAK